MLGLEVWEDDGPMKRIENNDEFNLSYTESETAGGTLVTERPVSISMLLLARAFLRSGPRFLSSEF